ncbi:MAG: hypothetical protein HY712_01455 [candidate division NC10 bacterium]|nr:hypothetical protein [candidate division NC10 bacterium]
MTAPRLRHCVPRVALVSALAMVLLVSACGRRGAPQPPAAAAPEAVMALRAEAQTNTVLVIWTKPMRNQDGSALYDLREFRLFRATGSDTTFEPIATIQASFPQNAVVQGPLYLFVDDGGGRGLDPTLRYAYRIQALNTRGLQSPLSSPVQVEFLAAPPAPTGLSAAPRDNVIELSWEASPPGREGVVPVRGYNVYRGSRTSAYGAEPINPRPVTATRFRDAGVESDTPYFYVVRSVGSDRPPWRESGNSNEASAVLEDRTPPSPPQGLTALPDRGLVALTWRANAETDLLGYLVYRREPPTLLPVRLTETPVQPTTFTDRTARPGATYIYTVTAVDRAPRRNESAPSAEVEVTVGR